MILAFMALAACAPAEPPASPPRLYVFDVRALHLDHFALCGGPCAPGAPPPPGKTYASLLDDYDTLIFFSSLQGVVNKSGPQLYLIHHPADRFWLDTFQAEGTPYGWLAHTQIIYLPDFEAVLATFGPQIDGLVEWDDAVPATLNVATTIAGVEGWPVVRRGSALAAALSTRWPVKQSLAGAFADNLAAYRWAVDRYLLTGKTNPTLLAYLEDGLPAVRYRQKQMTRGGVYALERDYVIQQRGFAFDLSPWRDEAPADADLMAEILQAARREAGLKLVKIWGFIPWYEKYAAQPGAGGSHSPVDGEWESAWLFSYYAAYLQGGGGDAWGAAMANISVHRFAPKPDAVTQPPPPPSTAELTARGYLLPDGSVNPDLTFILFYMGDYDLVHPTVVALAGWERSTWVNAGRGKIPLAWGINPGMEEEIPGVMAYMLATRTENDFLVAANSGAGYINPQGLSRRYRRQWLVRSGDYYRKYGLT
ncbi:MAG: GxGYxYP domain-containing protein, partial [Anaerolineae bacterium]